jgi:hypothetical protein
MWIAFLLATSLVAVSPNVAVEPLTGSSSLGAIVSLDQDTVVVEGSKGRETFPTAKLAGVSIQGVKIDPPSPTAIWVETIDGSLFAATQYTASKGKADIASAHGAISLATDNIRSVRLQPMQETLATPWAKLFEHSPTGDFLVLRKGDSLDATAGIVRGVQEDSVQFEIDGETLSVKRGKLYGLGYHRVADRTLPATVCFVADRSGSLYAASAIAFHKGNLEWTTPAGLKISRPLDSIRRIDFSRGKIARLSDLAPESSEWIPYLGGSKPIESRAQWFGPVKDRSPAGGPIMIDGVKYEKGLSLHSKTTLVYRLPAGFTRFQAIVGIDDRARPLGNVRCVIRADDRTLFEAAIAGTQPPKTLDLDISGARRLTILVDFGDESDVGDQLNLGDARLVK